MRVTALLIGLLFFADGAVYAEESAIRIVELSGHGSIAFNVPASWQSSVRQPPNGLPPTIVFTPKSGEPFQILVSPVWPMRGEMNAPTQAELKDNVQSAAEKAAPQSVERMLDVKTLSGSKSVGYYFTATDKAPNPGEFKYLTQGMLGVGDLRVAFTILTNDGQSRVVSDALSMLSQATRR